VPCPTCRTPAPFDKTLNAFRPFCSERCKDIDFGAWATEQYAVAAQPDPSDLDELEAQLSDPKLPGKPPGLSH
jgi:uncharacterized protein